MAWIGFVNCPERAVAKGFRPELKWSKIFFIFFHFTRSLTNLKTNLTTRLVTLAAALAVASVLPARENPGQMTLSHEQVENIVRRSYQYVALYNIINKGAMEPGLLFTDGWNKLKRITQLADADVKAIARPNNDTLYQIAILDLRNEPMILDIPAFDSKYVSLETSAYDHYCEIPVSTRLGNYGEPMKLLFYTARTKGYKAGDKIRGVDRYLEMSGDFAIAFHRIMPHANDPKRFEKIVGEIGALKLMSLSEFQGKTAKSASSAEFPAFGKTDADVFGNNLLEVMQFVFNHSTFDPNDELDQAVLAAYKPLGVEPGKAWDPATAAKIDGAMFREVCEEVRKANFALAGDPARAAALLPRLFLPKGKMDLNAQVLQSVFGPIGAPATEALYPPITTEDGKPMNAQHDYVIKMSKEEMPPAQAFWSLTLYDTKNGFFIPNPQKKYSVGENAGYKLGANGGIEIHVAAQKPDGVPEENWLPINRGDENLDLVMRVYVPDLAKMKTWKAPKAVLVK